MSRRPLLKITAIITSAAIATLVHATETATTNVSENLYINGGGYTQLKIDTNMEQKYPLLQVMTIQMPPAIKYIGQGLNYILSLSGYRLEPLSKAEQEVLSLYSLRLPITNRSFTKATTLQIVETIVGVGFEVSVDEVRRTIRINAAK